MCHRLKLLQFLLALSLCLVFCLPEFLHSFSFQDPSSKLFNVHIVKFKLLLTLLCLYLFLMFINVLQLRESSSFIRWGKQVFVEKWQLINLVLEFLLKCTHCVGPNHNVFFRQKPVTIGQLSFDLRLAICIWGFISGCNVPWTFEWFLRFICWRCDFICYTEQSL